MKYISAVLLGLGLATAAPIAAPISTRDTECPKYNLKTQYIAGDKTKDGLYVDAYHTGAGFNDAVLISDVPENGSGFLNGTVWQFNLGTDYPWSFSMPGDTNYAGWENVGINVGSGGTGFYINSTDAPGLLWNPAPGSSFSEDEFKNWLVCDWVHGGPQLFWHSRYENFDYPSSCAEVWLIPEPVSS